LVGQGKDVVERREEEDSRTEILDFFSLAGNHAIAGYLFVVLHPLVML
jgi:hypothetical protein